MAYKYATNIALSTDKPKTVFQHVRDFLTASGLYNTTTGVGEWTVINSYYAVNSTTLTDNDWCLLKTTGETGVWDFRILIKVTSAGIQCWSGTVWSGLTGSSPTVSQRYGINGECITTPANWTALYLYADKDFCAIIVRAGTTTWHQRFGIAVNLIPEYMAPLPLLAATTSGASKQMSVSDSSNSLLAVGNRVQLLDYTTGSESSQITANDTGTDIVTVGSNQYGYSTAGYLCSMFPYLVDGVIAKLYYSSFYSFTNPTSEGYNSYPFGYMSPIANVTSDTVTPCPFNQKFPAERVIVAVQNSGGCSLVLPSWVLLTRKRTVEEDVHTLGSDNYRYFHFHADTLYGFLMKEA
jgi:hypothetical protein